MVYCTLTSKEYLLTGLTMYASLRKFTKDKLYWLCLDDETYDVISKYKDIEAVKLDELDTKDIEKLRTNPPCSYALNNPYAQFCWGLTPYFTWYVLKKHKEVLYVDSDIQFLQSPELIQKACKGYEAGIHTHRFGVAHKYLYDDVGEFNVGCVYFSKEGAYIAEQWKDWLLDPENKYAKEYGRCGDQKYLNLFSNFKKVKIFDDEVGYAAPWNYNVQEIDNKSVVFKAKKTPLVFIHFARFHPDFINNKWVCGYIPNETFNSKSEQSGNMAAVKNHYEQYFKDMKEQRKIMLNKKNKATDVKICFAMIVYNSDYVLKQTLDSIYEYASQIVINHAPVKNFKNKPDNTGKILSEYKDPDNKITIINVPGDEKTDLCKSYMPLINKDIEFLWTIDADEVFKPEDIKKTIAVLKERKPHVVGFIMRTFVGGFTHYLTGYERNYNVRRIFKYEPGCKYVAHRPPKLSTENVKDPVIIEGKEMFEKYDVEFYHYSYVFPRQVKEKVEYYESSVIAKGNCIPNFFENVWLRWAMNKNRDRIEEKYKGVHEFEPKIRGECLPEKFEGTHPMVIENVRTELQKRLDEELKYYSSLTDNTTCWYQKGCADEMNMAIDPTMEANHFKIFTQLLPWLEARGSSIIDLGCGGAQLSELCEDFIYEGADLKPIIENCSKKNFPKNSYKVCDIVKDDISWIKDYDIVITSALIDVSQHPLEILDKILKHTKRYFILHRQEITEKGMTEVTKNDSYGGQTYHSIISRDDFNEVINKNNFEVVKKLQLDYSWENGGESLLLKKLISKNES